MAVSIGGGATALRVSPARWSPPDLHSLGAAVAIQRYTKLPLAAPHGRRSQPSPIDHRTARRSASSGAMEISVLLRTTGNGDGPRALPMSEPALRIGDLLMATRFSSPLPRFSVRESDVALRYWRAWWIVLDGFGLTRSGFVAVG